MQRPKIDQYFEKKGIKVFYNTLGMTEELVEAYVANFKPLLEQSGAKRSNQIKQACYETLYPIESRQKKTGFEDLQVQDRAFRERIVNYITDVFYGPTMDIVDHSGNALDYKNLLVSHLSDITDPVLYLSGGVDSELVARAFIEADKPFKCVLFKWLDKNGHAINSYEIDYATRFCQANDLDLDIIELDVESLWESDEFADFARDIQIQSTHQLTHAWAVPIVENKYPGSTHLFGGEVRFSTSNIEDSRVNVVFLDKVDPPAYSGGTFFGATSAGGLSSCTLRYNNATGQYTITGLNVGSSSTGTWTTTPGSSYEFQVTNATIDSQVGSTTTNPISWPTSWTPINTTNTTICRVETNSAFSQITATFYIDVRVVGQVSPVVSSVITMSAEGVV